MCSGLICGISTVAVGAALVVASTLVGFYVIPNIVEDTIINNVILLNNTEQMDRFQELPFPLQFSVKVFNITNAPEVLQGSVPIMTELGPYVYKMYFHRVVENMSEDKMSYRILLKMEFDTEASFPHTEDDFVTVTNVAYHGVLQVTQSTMPILMGALNLAMGGIFGEHNAPIINARVGDLLLDGITLCRNPGLLGVFACSIIRNMANDIQNMEVQPDQSIKFSVFGYRDGSPGKLHEIIRGIQNHADLGRIVSLDGNAFLPYWRTDRGEDDENNTNGEDNSTTDDNNNNSNNDNNSSKGNTKMDNENSNTNGDNNTNEENNNTTEDNNNTTEENSNTTEGNNITTEDDNNNGQGPDETEPSRCDMINGTDSGIFAPFVDKTKSLYALNTDICRSVELRYQYDLEFKGIPAYRFSANEWFLDNNEGCFCMNLTSGITALNGCLLRGAQELFTCVGAYMVLSYPHFLYADDRYRNGVMGMNPVEENHRIFLDLEPNTGTVIRGGKRAQFNVFMRAIEGIPATQHLRTTLTPILWIEEGISLSDEYAEMLYNDVVWTMSLVDILVPVVVALCCAVLLAGIGIVLCYRFKKTTV